MRFQSIQTALVSTLGAAAASRYRTVGYEDRPISSDEVYNTNKLVSVVYKSGVFPRDTSSHSGPATHTCNFDIELLLSQPAKVDVATLESGSSTAVQRATALAALQDSKNLANAALDSFIDIIWNILLDNRNMNLGLDQAYIGNRWINGLDKDDPMYFSDCVICTAKLKYEIEVQEDFTGDIGTAGDKINLTLKLNDEPTDGQAGVSKNI